METAARLAGPVRHLGLADPLGSPAARHRPQDEHRRHSQCGVQGQRRGEGEPDAAGAGDGVLGAHHLVHHPRLATNLGDDPAALEGDDRRDAGDGRGAQEPARARDVATAPPRKAEPGSQADQHHADAHHRVECQVEQRVRRWAISGRDRVQPGDLGVRVPVDQERVQAIDPDCALDAVLGADSAEVLGHVPVGRLHALHGGELDRLVVGDRPGGGVAHQELEGRRDRRHGERDQQAETVVAVAPSPQHPDGVDGRDQKARHQVGGQDHVRDLVGDRGVEDDLQRLDVGDLPVDEREPLRLIHPGVGGDHGEGAAEPGDHDRNARPEVRPAREPLPAVDVDRDEDRLHEEEDPLDREQDPEHAAEAPRELGPQEPELERQHGAGDGAHREGHRRDLRPALRELQCVGVVAAKSDVVGDQHDRREGDAQTGQDDVEPERERHLAAGGRQPG